MLAEGEISPGLRKGVLVDPAGRVILGTSASGPGSASEPNVGIRSGYVLKKASVFFARPPDALGYSIGDAITNSTTAPTVFQLDLAALGAVAGQAIEIRKISVVCSSKQALLPLVGIFLSNTTFAATADNAPLDIPDDTVESGIIYCPCDIQSSTVSNSQCDYYGTAQPIILAPADTKLYGTLQAANAYIPTSADKFTINAWIALL